MTNYMIRQASLHGLMVANSLGSSGLSAFRGICRAFGNGHARKEGIPRGWLHRYSSVLVLLAVINLDGFPGRGLRRLPLV